MLEKYRVILAYNNITDYSKIASQYKIDFSTVLDWIKQRKEIFGMRKKK